MTTPAAEKLYLAQHQVQMEGKSYAVFNPHNQPVSTLPFIIGFNNGGSPGWWSAELLAEDGMGLGGHICSDEAYMLHDLGILEGTREDRHKAFQEHYPNGYRMDFVSYDKVKDDPRLTKAFELNNELRVEHNANQVAESSRDKNQRSH
jgi:hypothetical protein